MSREQQILSLLKQSKTKSFTPKQIAEAIDNPYNLVKMPLRRLMIKGFVKNPVRGKYVLKVTKSNIKSNKKVTRVTKEKVTKGSIESDKRDRESDKGYITLPVSDARKRTTLDLKNRTIVILNWKKTCLGRSMSNLVDEAVQKQWGKNS
ncbi:MAG: hypothetical protein QMC80_01615 [Thermoplasmatales archaeon]|nr:hypothetical protein [Thermoplasmatales archaeon]